MATTEGTNIQQNNRYVQQAYFTRTDLTGSAQLFASMGGPDVSSSTVWLTAAVPADGAELVDCFFTVINSGTVSTSGTNAWSISDGTNVLATLAATSVTQAANTVVSMTMGTATNGKNIATTKGSRLILTNTEAGTVSANGGITGFFTLVWAL